METTFRIHSPAGGPPLEAIFTQVSDMLCRECGKDRNCREFYLTSDYDEYLAHPGPKIGWVAQGNEVHLRMANCKQISRVEHITQMLKLFDLNVVESRYVQ